MVTLPSCTSRNVNLLISSINSARALKGEERLALKGYSEKDIRLASSQLSQAERHYYESIKATLESQRIKLIKEN